MTTAFEEQKMKETIERWLIIRYAAWHSAPRQTLDQFNWQGLEPLNTVGLDPSLDRFGLGHLEMLPRELQHKFVESLDPHSANLFRQTNRAASRLVEETTAWRVMKDQTGDFLRACIYTRVSGVSLGDIFGALCSPSCVCCGDLGGFIYLMTADRVCWTCLGSERRFLPLTAFHLWPILPISTFRMRETLPTMRMPSGANWGPTQILSPRFPPIWLVDRSAVERTYGFEIPNDRYFKLDHLCGAIINVPILRRRPINSTPLEPVYCVICQGEAEEEYDDKWMRQFDPRNFMEHVAEEHPMEYQREIKVFSEDG